MAKKCRYDISKRCLRSSCSIFDSASGNIRVCPLFRGGDFFDFRKISLVHVSVFSKHLRRLKRSEVG